MVIGVLRLTLYLPENHSLKGKRSVLRKIKARVANEFNVSVTECDGHDLWQRAFAEIARRYPDIEANTQFVDAVTMWMVLKPDQYEVIVTNNMFGDIITDLGAALQGGLGMASSGNIHPGKVSLFEPVHGSAPKYAGKNVTNPIGAIMSAGLMLDYIGYPEAAKGIEKAVIQTIATKQVTRDLGGSLTTTAAGDAICSAMK